MANLFQLFVTGGFESLYDANFIYSMVIGIYSYTCVIYGKWLISFLSQPRRTGWFKHVIRYIVGLLG